MEAHRGLEGVWVDDSGRDASYQFREGGEFLIRQKLLGTLAPFSDDPGVEYRPCFRPQKGNPELTPVFSSMAPSGNRWHA
jgi:hypothetical protein